MAKRRTKKRASPSETLATILRSEVIGIFLLLLALLTLLLLATATRDNIGSWWVGNLQLFFGIGAWLSPLVVGFIGGWLVWRSFATETELRLRRPIGVTVIFLTVLAAVQQ